MDEVNDEELNKILKDRALVQAQSDIVDELRPIEKLIESEINTRYASEKEKVFKNDDINEMLANIAKKTAAVQLEDDMLAILSKEQKNQLAKHILDCQKEQLEYRKKKEKRLVKEQVKADVFNKKVDVLKKKYGYLYNVDENGQIKDFIPNKAYNRYRAFVKWYSGTGDGFKKITKTTLKVLLWVGIAVVIGILGYKLVMWIGSLNLPKV